MSRSRKGSRRDVVSASRSGVRTAGLKIREGRDNPLQVEWGDMRKDLKVV
jgi:hypothetical protein